MWRMRGGRFIEGWLMVGGVVDGGVGRMYIACIREGGGGGIEWIHEGPRRDRCGG